VGVREREDAHVQKAAYVNISLKRKIACTRHNFEVSWDGKEELHIYHVLIGLCRLSKFNLNPWWSCQLLC
jgi:hypothetical protein